MPGADTINEDLRFLLRALALARRAQGRVEPNPMVGCVVAHGGRIIAEGYHRRFGGPHAEVDALSRCTRSTRGATAYVTLEPCCHYGRTPPCVDALIKAGVKTVVAPLADPNPLICGRGFRKLRRAGITVRSAIAVRPAAELLAPFATRMTLERPYVIAKWAQGPDGDLTRPAGMSPWISGDASRRWTHRLRARVDAILVGINTLLRDDPRLTARDVPVRRVATRVVMDRRLRTPAGCRLVREASAAPVLIMTSPGMAASRRADQLRRLGIEIAACETCEGRLVPSAALRILADRGATNVLVEGGPHLLRSFFTADLIDEVCLVIAPLAAIAPTRGHRPEVLTDVLAKLHPVFKDMRLCGDDLVVHMQLHDPVALFRNL